MNPNETQDLIQFIPSIRDQFDLTVLLIEHDMKVVMDICGKIWVIDYGITIAERRCPTYSKQPRVIEAYPRRSDNLGLCQFYAHACLKIWINK